MKKSGGIILLLLVMILAMSVVGAADTNVTSDIAESQEVDDSAVAVEGAAVIKSAQNTEVLAAGDKNFTQLQHEIDATGNVILNSNYVRTEGDNDIVITQATTIIGNDAYKIDANNLGGIFKINQGSSLILMDVILVNGNSNNGGAIYNEGNVTIVSSQLTGNNASIGGAIYNNGVALISGSTLNGNTATDKGGAIYSTNQVTVNGNSIFTDNTANSGGAVYVDSDGTLTATNVKFEHNIAEYDGGAIYTDGGIVDLTDCVLDSNDVTKLETSIAENRGGAAIYAKNAQLTLTNTNVTNNGRSDLDRSKGDMINAVLHLINSNTIVTGGLFENNTGIYGGAINAESDATNDITITGATFNNNKAYNGGAINLHNMNTAISDCTFTDNWVIGPGSSGYNGLGGAVAVDGDGSFTLTNSNFTGNHADGVNGSAGAVSAGLDDDCAIIIDNCTFRENTAVYKGGAVLVGSDVASISNSTFSDDNEAEIGDSIYNGGNLKLSNNTVEGDTSGIYSSGKGKIDTHVWVIVNNDEDVTVEYYDVLPIVVKITDDAGNLIEINRTTLTIRLGGPGTMNPGTNLVRNTETGLFEGEITITRSGQFYPNRLELLDFFAYDQNENLNSSYVNMNKANATLDVIYQNVSYPNDVVITINLTGKQGAPAISVYATGSYKLGVTVNDVTYYVRITNGIGSQTISGLPVGNYVINASWVGNAQYNSIEPQLYELIVTPMKGTYSDLQYQIDNAQGGVLDLAYDFTYNEAYDADKFPYGVIISDDLTINGNNHFIDGNNTLRIFSSSATVSLNDIVFKNGKATEGGAIYTTGNLDIDNCTFINNTAADGNDIYVDVAPYQVYLVYDEDSYNAAYNGTDSPLYKYYQLNPTEDVDTGDPRGHSWNAAISANPDYSTVPAGKSRFPWIVLNMEDPFTGYITVNFNGTKVFGPWGLLTNKMYAIISVPGSDDCGMAEYALDKDTGHADKELETELFEAFFANDEGVISATTNPNKLVSVSDSTFIDNADGYSIYNKGNLELNGNTISNIIYNEGNITSEVTAVVLNNKTYETAENSFKLNATLTDDSGNNIYDKNLKFTVNDEVLDLINYTNGIYTYDAYPIAFEPEYVVNLTSAGEDRLSVKTGIIKNLKYGTFTDLAGKILDAILNHDGVLNLTYDFAYTPDVDGVYIEGIIIGGNSLLTINGNNHTISGSKLSGIFNIQLDNIATFNDIIFSNAYAGAILTTSKLIIDNCTFINNTNYYDGAFDEGGAISSTGGELVISDSAFIKNTAADGGAIFVEGANTTVTNCVFTNNTAAGDGVDSGCGGAIYADEQLTVNNCVFTNNIASTSAPSAEYAPSGGAISAGGLAIITNSNFTNNSADEGGAIKFGPGSAIISNCSFTENEAEEGGAIYVSDKINTAELIVSDSSFTNNTACNCGGAITIDATNGADIKYEIAGSNFTDNYIDCDGTCPAVAGGAVYTVGTALGTISSSQFKGNKALRADDKANGGAIKVQFGGASTIEDCVFTANEAAKGAAIDLQADTGMDNAVIVNNCSFTSNVATQAGGAIACLQNVGYSNLSVNNSRFMSNKAPVGGAIYLDDLSKATVEGSNFTDNGATKGGAIYALGDLEVDNSTFENNTAELGGAIYASDKYATVNLDINGSTFTENVVSDAGGAIAIDATNGNGVAYNIFDSKFDANKAVGLDTYVAGGAVYTEGAAIGAIVNSNFTENAAKNGGAIYASGNLTVTGSEFKANDAEEGTAIYISNSNAAELTVDGCNFTDNVATNGGAIISNGTNGIINGSYFSNNGNDIKVFNINNLADSLIISNNLFDIKNATIFTDKEVYIYGENVTVYGEFYWGVNNLPINITFDLCKDGAYNASVRTELTDVAYSEVLKGLSCGSYVASIDYFTEDAYGNSYRVITTTAAEFVIKANATISVTVGENKRFDYATNGTDVLLYIKLFDISFDKGITDNVTVIVNDTSFTVEVINGTAAVNVTVFAPGVYAVVAEFVDDDNHYISPIYASDVFTLLNPERTLSIEVDDTIFGVPAVATITVKDYEGNLTEGTVELVINETVILLPVNGTLTVPITNLAVGKYLINATLLSTEFDGAIVNDTETFTVDKAPTSVDIITVVNATYPDDVLVVFAIGNETEITVEISQNGTSVSSSRIVIYNDAVYIGGLDAGVYTINITNADNENYTSSSGSALFEITKATPSINVTAVDVIYPGDVVVTVTSVAAGEVTVTVGDKNVTETVEAGVAKNITISGLAANEEGYDIVAELAETANYTAGVNDTETVKVMKAASSVQIDDIADVIYNATVEVTYTVENATDVSIVVKNATGTEITTGVNTTVAGKVVISGLNAGEYTIAISNAGDSNHTASSAEATFNVLKATITIEPNATGDFVVDGEVNITFTLPKDIDGIVQVTIDGIPVLAFIFFNGTCTVPGSYAAGSHIVSVSLTDDTNYENQIGQTTFDIVKVNATMDAAVEAGTAIEPVNVTVTLPEDATGLVLVQMDGKNIGFAEVKDGTAEISISSPDEGEHNITVTYTGDDKYNSVNYTATFNTERAPTNTTINVTVDGFDVEITVNVNSSAVVEGGKLTLTFNGENFTSIMENGVLVFRFTNLDANTYPIVASYGGNKYFLPSNATSSAIVVRKSAYLKPVYEPFIFNYGHLYRFKLVDKEGNGIAGRTVEFSVHSKVYYVTTGSDGWGEIQITPAMLIQADKIFSRLIFRGDSQYKPATYAVWFNAMQEPAKFSNVKAVKTSYKVSESNKQVTATLKDSKGKVIAGKQVSVTIKGKTINAKTNSKGVVTFNLDSVPFSGAGTVAFIVIFEDVNYKRTTFQNVINIVKD